MSLYTLSGLKKIYEQKTVLNIADLSVEEGIIYALMGSNGAGKTTLLNLLAFLDSPSEGRVSFRSQNVRFLEKEMRSLRRQVVLVDQKPLLFSTSVYKNLEYGLKIRKVPQAKRAELISEALELVGMQDFQNQSALNLSGGETQRIALARAFVLQPKVLLCDEPTANVDFANQLVIIDLIRKINATKRISIIFTTHDSSLAVNLAQKTLHLVNGCITNGRMENNFPGYYDTHNNGIYSCVLPRGTRLETAASCPDKYVQKTCYISIDPWQIGAFRDVDEVPEINRLKGKIQKIEMTEAGIRLMFEAEDIFTVMMTKKNYEQLKIVVGEELSFVIKPEAIQVIS